MRIIRVLLLTALTSLVDAVAFAQILLTNDKLQAEVEGHLSYLRDRTDTLTIENIRNHQFTQLPLDRVPTLGFDRASHWFRLEVANQSAYKEWYIEVGYAPLDLVEIYLFDDSVQKWVVKKSGDSFPISAREVRHRNPIVSITMESQVTREIYVHVKSISSIQVPITFWEPTQFYKSNYEIQFKNGVFYGVLLIMVFYNLFLYISIRDKITLFYVLTLLSGMNVIAFFQGYGFFYLYPEQPQFNNLFAIFSGPLFIITSSLLTRAFLNLPSFSQFLDRLITANALLAISFSLTMYVLLPRIPFYYLHYLTIFHCFIILVSAAYCFFKKYRPARYFLLAWVTLLMAAVALSLKNLGIIPANYVSSLSLYVGGIMQTLLISFAIGDRFNILTKENQQAKEKEFDREREAKEQLEKEVLARTADLRLKNQQLEELNVVKDKLFSIISHDLKGPLNSLKGSLTVLQMGGVTEVEFKKLIDGIGVQLHHTSDFLSNLLQWAKMQMDGQLYLPEEIDLSTIAENNFQLLKSEFLQKDVTPVNAIEKGCKVWADLNMVDAVFRNIISNAIKYSRSGGKVTIATLKKKEAMEISIRDTGVGIASNQLSNLFTLQGVTTQGTREEKGTGIGLVLCKELIEKNGGKIWASSTVDEGSTITFSLPLKK